MAGRRWRQKRVDGKQKEGRRRAVARGTSSALQTRGHAPCSYNTATGPSFSPGRVWKQPSTLPRSLLAPVQPANLPLVSLVPLQRQCTLPSNARKKKKPTRLSRGQRGDERREYNGELHARGKSCRGGGPEGSLRERRVAENGVPVSGSSIRISTLVRVQSLPS